jgi:pilus assembly protein Flp/PilA
VFAAVYVNLFTRFKARTETGASLVEYALLVAFIAVVCIAAVAFFGSQVTDSFSKSASKLP